MATVVINRKPPGSKPSLASLAWKLHDEAERKAKKQPAQEEAPPTAKPKAKFPKAAKPPQAKAKKRKSPPADKSALTIPKEHASQHGTYMAIVRRLACRRCGAFPPSEKKGNEFCHKDEGKGMGIKTDVREGWAGCPRCHKEVGEGKMPRTEKRILNEQYAASTRREVVAKGLWPKNLPAWTDKP